MSAALVCDGAPRRGHRAGHWCAGCTSGSPPWIFGHTLGRQPDFALPRANGRHLDLGGSSGNPGRITTNTSFAVLSGTDTSSFLLGGSTRGDTHTVTVAMGSIFNEVITLASNAGLQAITRTITPGSDAGTGALSFGNAGGDNLGHILDKVLLDFRAPTTVPEPSTLALGGLLAAARRRAAR